LRGLEFKFVTVSGTFSLSQVDKGTQTLIDNAVVDKGWKILDLGCGWGPVGVTFAKLGFEVVMTDTNRRACEYAKKNLELNKAKARVFTSNAFEKIKDEFDTILLNPPQTAGKAVCFGMIEESIGFLKKSGLFQIVARHNKGGKTLSKKMEEIYGNVTDIAKSGGFRVYISKKL